MKACILSSTGNGRGAQSIFPFAILYFDKGLIYLELLTPGLFDTAQYNLKIVDNFVDDFFPLLWVLRYFDSRF